MLIFQLVYCLLQFVCYRLAEIDLNQLIFVDIFHVMENASAYKPDGTYNPSGLCWHASFMAPVVVLAYFFCPSWWSRGLAIIDALICGNSTALIGICACIGLDVMVKLMHFLRREKKTVWSYLILIVLIASVPAGIILLKTNIGAAAIHKLVFIYQRITGSIDDGGSAAAHMRYYTAFPEVMEISDLKQIFFGYGLGCSGYPFGVLYEQYAELKSWAVECDVMNIFYSRGVIGTILFYAFLLTTAVKGSKLNKAYWIMMCTIMIEGITYNIQFDWLFFIEVFLYFSVKYGYDLFSPNRALEQ